MSPIRILENFLGKSIDKATLGSPVRVIGWNKIPTAGSTFNTFDSKKAALEYIAKLEKKVSKKENIVHKNDEVSIPIIIKTDVTGGLAAVKKEIAKISIQKVSFNIIGEGVGDISENDIKKALGTIKEDGSNNALVIGFHVGTDKRAEHMADRAGVSIKTFSIIYSISDWLTEVAEKRKPKIEVEETTGTAKILRIFSKTKNKQVLGGRVKKGVIKKESSVKILRRDYEIGRGKIIELQQQKIATQEVGEDTEFGILIESKAEVAEGDIIEAFHIVIS